MSAFISDRLGLNSLPKRVRNCSPVRPSRAAAAPPFLASGRERPNARISGEIWRCTRRWGPVRGHAQAAVVHTRREARRRQEAAQRRVLAACGMARARQRYGRDEFETYDWWRKTSWYRNNGASAEVRDFDARRFWLPCANHIAAPLIFRYLIVMK